MLPILSANDLIKPNPGLMFWTLITFVIVLVVLKRYAYKPIQAALDARRDQIQSDVDSAENARKEAQDALAEYRQALAESRKEAGRIVDERKRDIAQIEEEKARQLQRAKEEIQAETRRSLQAIRDQLAELTLLTTEKVVRKQLDEAEQRRLIEEALADVDFQQFVSPEGAAAEESD